MQEITIYDPPMCCSTGVCGPSPDQELVRLAAHLDKLAKTGVEVKRHNLAQEPEAFVQEQRLQQLLMEKGTEVLPVVMVDGKIKLQGRYPTKEELESWQYN